MYTHEYKAKKRVKSRKIEAWENKIANWVNVLEFELPEPLVFAWYARDDS